MTSTAQSDQATETSEASSSVIFVLDGRYKARWQNGMESETFEVKNQQFKLYGTQYTFYIENSKLKFNWPDGTVQEAMEVKNGYMIVWKAND